MNLQDNKEIGFLPWEGDKYGNGILGYDNNNSILYGKTLNQGKKIMVLGESHYCANPETEATKDITIKVIEDLLDPLSEHEGYKNTYTKFAKSFIGNLQYNQQNKEDFWQHILFYNYVQSPITGTRIAPSDSQFKESEKAFFEILSKYQPDLVIVWGKRLYTNLPQSGKQLADLEITQGQYVGKATEIWSYQIGTKTIPIMPITHPSAGYELELHNAFIKEFIEQY